MRRRILLTITAVAILGGLSYALWPRARPHLLLVTLDTTRADRLGCYGYAEGKTPVLDALAASGVLCERAYTVAPLTLPAHASLFTGLCPAESGVRTNGRGRLNETLPTLAEILKRQGYDTAAFVASFVLDGKFGLDRGFNIYDDDFDGDLDDDAVGDSGALHRHRNGAAVVDAALAWLAQPRSHPFFCWVHLYDPHAPYLSHSDLFGDEFAERPYDAEIAYVDRQVARLVDFLKARRLEDQTLVVVVGDHGEGLGEHIERTHGLTLYNATMRVPLIFRHPAKLPAGRRIAANVSLIDVSPTILDQLGLSDPRKITGRSFRRALREGPVEYTGSSSPCYGATDDPYLINGWSPLRSLTDGDWKYIRTTRPELYDLTSDPNERNNLVAADPEQARKMESGLADFESRLVVREESEVQLSAAEHRALASLGYAGSAPVAAAGPAPANLPDVKDMLGCYIAVDEALKLVHEGEVEAGIEQLRAVVRQAPTHTMANWNLAWTLWELSKTDGAKTDGAKTDETQAGEAMQVFRALLAIRPDCHEAHHGLGLMLLQQNKVADAIAEFRKALEVHPELAEVHFNLAKALLKTGRLDESLAHFSAAVECDPRHAAAYQWRAYVRARLGQIDGAIADYRKSLKYDPDSPMAHHNFGSFLAKYGDAGEARQHLARAVALNPQSAQLQYYLGAYLLGESNYEEAVTHLVKALELQPGYTEAEEKLQAARQALAGRKGASE